MSPQISDERRICLSSSSSQQTDIDHKGPESAKVQPREVEDGSETLNLVEKEGAKVQETRKLRGKKKDLVPDPKPRDLAVRPKLHTDIQALPLLASDNKHSLSSKTRGNTR
jgi:hypothetical protein